MSDETRFKTEGGYGKQGGCQTNIFLQQQPTQQQLLLSH